MMRQKLFQHGEFLVVSLCSQLVQVLVGLAAIRILAKEEFSYVAICWSICGLMSVLSVGGLAAGFNQLASERFKEGLAIDSLVASYFELRRSVFAYTLLPILGVAWFMLDQLELSGWRWISIGVLLLAASASQLSLELVTFPSHALGEFKSVSRLKAMFIFLFAPVTVLLVWAFPLAESILLCAAASQVLQHQSLKRVLAKRVDLNNPSESSQKASLLKTYLAMFPNSFYYAFQGNLNLMILGGFGLQAAVADLGALQKLGRATSVLSTYQRSVAGPRLTRSASDADFNRILLKVLAGSLVISACIVAGGIVFRDAVVWLLGSGYDSLDSEVSLFSCSIALNFFTGSIVTANTSRGFIWYSTRFQIAASILGLVVGAAIFDLTTVFGVIQMAILGRVPVMLVQLADLTHGVFCRNRA